MKFSRLTPCAAAVAAAVIQMAQPASAATCTLTTNGLWQTPGDWSCNARPGNGDAATINVSGLVTVNQAEQITTLSNAGTINIDAVSLSLLSGGSTINSGIINVGGASTAALLVSNNINNAGGTINVGAGSVINQSATTITGGTIATTGTGALVASNNSGNVLSGVTLNGTLDLATNAGFEQIGGAGLTLNGKININQNSVLAFSGGAQTLAGNGTVTLGNTGSSNRITIENSGVLTTGANILIHGENGTIGSQVLVGGASTLNNGGTVSADVSGGVISLVAATTNNTNTLSAKNGGQLMLSGNVANSGAGHIDAIGAGSIVSQNGVTVAGGTINTSGGGTYVAANNGSNYLSGVTLNGVLDLATTAGQVRVQNGMTLVSGSNVNINQNSIFAFDGGTQTLGGTGTVTFGNTGSSNRLTIENTGTLTVGSGVLIHGENGTIGGQAYVGGAATLINNGTISADVSGGTVTIYTANNATNAVQNNGILSAANGGTLVLGSNVTGNAGSSINVGSGSTVVQNGVIISGVVNNTGTGNFVATNNGGNVLNNVSFSGALNLASSAGAEIVRGNLALNGAVNINNNSTFTFEGGNQALTGTGTITLGDTGSSNRVGVDNTGTLTIGSGILIHGQNGTIGGQVNVGGGSTIINNGTISADVAGGTLTLVTNNNAATAFTNNGTLSAQNGGTLYLNTNVTGGSSGSIVAGAGSTVVQNGVTLSGAINTSGNGDFVATNNGSNYFNGVTLNGTLNLATNAGSEQIVNGLTLNGNINVNQNSTLVFQGGTQTLSGTGVVTLGNTGGSNRVGIDNTGTLNVGSGITIHGQNGTIGAAVNIGGASTLNNAGLISADVASGSIALAATTTNNSSTLSAQNGGQLVLNGTVNNLAGGHIDAVGAGSTVVQNGVTITGGTLNSSGGGAIVATNNGSNYLNAVTVAGILDLKTNAGAEQIVNGVTVNGDVRVNQNSVFVFAGGTQTLGGTGTITLGDSGSSNRIGVDNTGTLNIASGVTIHGQNGTIGGQVFVGGGSTINNAGTIRADVTGGIIDLSPGALTNNGTLAATAGKLNVNASFSGTGTVMTSGTGQVNLTGSNTSNTVGTLINNGTTSTALNLGSNNITVSGDYNNANFGVGNAFNRNANVAGSGAILAGGNVAEAITGTNVTTLGPTAAALTIGNVRVGANTFNYQVANTGDTGPAIRGAIQTQFSSGSSITDSRLSGTGVTAGNYGPVAAGAKSGDFGVTFTAASAGVIAPLANSPGYGTGQAVFVANNFANVTGQVLQINLASGAAAYNVAQPNVPTTVNLGNVHVGNAASQAVTIGNTSIGPAGYQEGLDVAIGTKSAGATASGSISNLAAGGTSNAVNVGLSNIGAGNQSGTVALNLASNGSTTSGLPTLALAPANVTINATGYNLASASVTPTPIVFANAHVGDSRTQALTVANTGPSGAFTEGLTGSFGAVSGNVTTIGSATGLIAAQASSSVLGVKLDTGTAGARAGSVAVNLVSDGTGTSGLGTTTLSSQTVTVSGNVYNLASSSTIGAINFGVRHVGDGVVTQNVSVTNTAAAGNFSEGLDSSFGAFSGTGGSKISTAGAIVNQAAGTVNSSTLQVRLDTSTVGTVTGNLQVLQASNGTISGLGNTALATQNPAVSADVQQATGTVVRYASPQINTTVPVDFGAVRINSTQGTALSITNNVPNDGFSEKLNASVTGTTNAATGSGGFAGLAPGGTDTTHVLVGLNTTAAGHQTGAVNVNFKSDGTAFNGGTITDLGTTAVGVQGDVYRLASPTVTTPNIVLASRVNGSASASIGITNTSPDSYTEGLSATRGATAGGFTSAGSFINLAAGASSNAITVALNTGTAGTFTGTQALSFASTGTGTTSAGDLALQGQSVGLTGKVYTTAVAQSQASVDFGIVHVGDSVSRGVSVANSAPVTSLNDVLVASAAGTSGAPFTAGGSLGTGLAAGATSANGLQVGLNTTSAGVYNNGSATFSAASRDGDLSDLALANLVVGLSGTVNNYAADAFSKTSGAGAFSQSGANFVLDFGTVVQGSATENATLVAGNTATGPADLFDGNFVFASGDVADFNEGNLASFINLVAGQTTGPLTFSFDTSTIGTFIDTITLHGIGHNGSGYSGAIDDIVLTIRGSVTSRVVTPPNGDVPEPDTILLLGFAIPVIFLRRARRKAAPAPLH